MRLVSLLLLLLGCSESKSMDSGSASIKSIWIEVAPEFVNPISDYLIHTPGDIAIIESSDDAVGHRVRIEEALDCSECYRIEKSDSEFVIKASDALGAQYGLSALLEAWGYRFHHPFDTWVPDVLNTVGRDHPALDETVVPDMAFRSIHMHTLHPIEGLAAFWMGGDGEAERASSIVDWVVKNRGNDIQWVSLDNIMGRGAHEEWIAHSRTVIEHAHLRGLTAGLGIQLFGSGNLQLAYDLLDTVGSSEDNEAQIRDRLMRLTDVGFDRFNLSFGEFFGEEPETFVAMVNLVGRVLSELDPHADLTTLIHVGDSEDQKVVYADQEMIYYFLAQFADPDIVPWVHTVMLYNLYEDAGGAYHHEEFDAHREFLHQRISDGEPTAYFPESSYWIAFDNSVPVYLPAYLRSRWLDQHRTKDDVGPMPGHILFSSGWEWGYWQTDVATLRLNHRLEGGLGVESGWEGVVNWMYSPLGDAGVATSKAIIDLANAQATALIHERLMPYLAGRDSTIDIGEAIGVIAQPMRIRLDRLADVTESQRDAFEGTVLEGLDRHGNEVKAILDSVPEVDNRWVNEVRDGMEVTWLRIRFISALYRAGFGHLSGVDVSAHLADADAAYDAAQTVVARRKSQTRDPDGERWMAASWDNPTIYQYGYLHHSDSLCFWERERLKLRAFMGEDVGVIPGCAL